MAGNLRERLFLFLWLLFFVLICVREYNSGWIPDDVKAELLEQQIHNKNSHILSVLQQLKSAEGLKEFEDFQNLKIDEKVLIYKNDSLIYWNTGEIRPPVSVVMSLDTIQLADIGFSKHLLISVSGSDGLQFIGIHPLWKDVGIDNEWLNKSTTWSQSERTYSNQNVMSLSTECCDSYIFALHHMICILHSV